MKCLNLYENYPTGFTVLPLILDYINERIKLYKIFYHTKIHTNFIKYSDDWCNYIKKLLNKHNLEKHKKFLFNNYDSYMDNICHWILLICYCKKSFSSQKYFINFECDWLYLRYKYLNNDVRLNCDKLEFKLFNNTEDVYMIHFTKVPNLLKQRKYIQLKGYLLIPLEDVILAIMENFSVKITNELKYFNKTLRHTNSDGIDYILKHIDVFEPISEYSPIGVDINLHTIDEYSYMFPLCMRHLHEELRNTHHLNYHGRRQYGLYLKWIGLSLEDSLKFWNDELKHYKIEKLNKYLYCFKHLYGQVGSKTDYLPDTCGNIINQHGCPYAHWDRKLLDEKLMLNYGIVDTTFIMEYIERKQYTQACAIVCAKTHNLSFDNSFEYPSQCFQMCMEKDIEDII